MTALNLKIQPKELKVKDGKAVVQTIMSKWLPLSPAALRKHFTTTHFRHPLTSLC